MSERPGTAGNSVERGSQAAANHERVLGVSFFSGTAEQAVEQISRGGLLVAPASPALLNLKFDESYRRALQQADVALADSALLATLWKLRSGRTLHNTSGQAHLKALLATSAVHRPGNALFVVRSDEEKRKAISRFEKEGEPVEPNAFYVAKSFGAEGEDHALLLHIEESRPQHVIIALRSPAQEKLGLYLRDYLLYRPSVHCVGAALGFLTGAEGPIPPWAERHQLGWLARLGSQPGMLIPRLGIAATIAAMVFKYGSELPKLRPRWSEL